MTEISTDKDLPLIRCECGAKIFLIPNLAELGKSIEDHANTHANKLATQEKMEEEANRIQDLLIAKTLQFLCQTM